MEAFLSGYALRLSWVDIPFSCKSFCWARLIDSAAICSSLNATPSTPMNLLTYTISLSVVLKRQSPLSLQQLLLVNVRQIISVGCFVVHQQLKRLIWAWVVLSLMASDGVSFCHTSIAHEFLRCGCSQTCCFSEIDIAVMTGFVD